MKTIAIVQARMGSSRLPGKSLLALEGRPVLEQVLTRLKRARRLDQIVVATTVLPEDDAIANLVSDTGCGLFRGSAGDVLDRYFRAALQFGADVIARITADCPLLDPGVVDDAIALREKENADFCANTLIRTFPKGLDVEVMTAAVLERLWRSTHDARHREHVTAAVYDDQQMCRTATLRAEADYSRLRWTLDTPADFEMISAVYRHFGGGEFGWRAVLDLLREHPEIARLNSDFQAGEPLPSFDDRCLA